MRCTAVTDPFGAAADPSLPSLPLALDPAVVRREFRRGLPALVPPGGKLRVRAIRVLRHKPGKRCLLEYDLRVFGPDGRRQKRRLLGKVRARRFGGADLRLQQALWDAGFDTGSADGISVARPVGMLPRLQMWLQAKVPGTVATDLLAAPGGVALARRVAEAAHKLHRAAVPTERRHTLADELRILGDCLQAVAQAEPRWASRLERLLSACQALAGRVPEPDPCGIHRDFYADQVIVDDPRLTLIDFDLYCLGDPALDVGNFLGHVTEQALRTLGDPGALAAVEQALEDRFVELAGEAVRESVRAYALLTLARHVYLSTRLPGRGGTTERLLGLCEQRVGRAIAGR